MPNRTRIRNVGLAVLGATALAFKHAYRGPFAGAVLAWGGNVAAAFALYFAAIHATARCRHPRLAAAAATLLAVEAFELTNGFGVMANVYDPLDLVANAAGVGLAVLVDLLTARLVLSQRPA
ncbi:MAG: hypothetical protein M5U13_18045 [Thermoanaerobaculia bacterium]|nr:hypothetical protein [Thermoanaerobaculia bacterium]